MKKKAFIGYTKKGDIIPGSLIVLNSNEYPKSNGGVWEEVPAKVIDVKYRTTTTTTVGFQLRCYNLVNTSSLNIEQDYIDVDGNIVSITISPNSDDTYICANSFTPRYLDIQYIEKGNCDPQFGCSQYIPTTTTTTMRPLSTTTTTVLPEISCFLIKNNTANTMSVFYIDKFYNLTTTQLQPFTTIPLCSVSVIAQSGLIITKVGTALSDCSNCVALTTTTTTTTTRITTTTTRRI